MADKEPIKKAVIHFRPLILTDENFKSIKRTPEEFSEMTRMQQLVVCDDVINEALEIDKVEIITKTK